MFGMASAFPFVERGMGSYTRPRDGLCGTFLI